MLFMIRFKIFDLFDNVCGFGETYFIQGSSFEEVNKVFPVNKWVVTPITPISLNQYLFDKVNDDNLQSNTNQC